MATDIARGSVVIFGGEAFPSGGPPALSAETWEWIPGSAPTVTQAPTPDFLYAGQAASLQVVADGHSQPLSFQWRRNGLPLSNGGPIVGATSATLQISPAQVPDTGLYDCVVSNACGQTTSTQATVTVNPVPCIGDADANGSIDFADITSVLARWGLPCP